MSANNSPNGTPKQKITNEMQVYKRSGEFQDVAFDKILARVKKLGNEANLNVINYSGLVKKIIDQLYDGIHTTAIDNLTAEQCAMMSTQHPEYAILAAYVSVSNHQKNTNESILEVTRTLYNIFDSHGKHVPLVSDLYFKYIETHHHKLSKLIDWNRDYEIDYFGFKTIERTYLLRVNDLIVERPQHMWLRVAVFLHMNTKNDPELEFNLIKETYDLMSQKIFIHATPTLFNSATKHPQLSSCFLVAIENDSIEGIYNTLKDCANISKWSGGIGIHVSNVRAANSRIYGTNGSSSGLVPMLRVFNSTARYCNQGGKRNGSFAIYLEPWHADVYEFLDMKRNQGDEEMKARDLFYALWIPDLFMERVIENKTWSLFCPNVAPNLSEVYGEEFKKLYLKYEDDGRAFQVVQARDLWGRILDAQMETGTPYILYKDAINRKNAQANLGIIKSSNLCTEITLYSDRTQSAVCNLASVSLKKMITNKKFDYNKLESVVHVIVRNLNNVIDKNFYPTDKTERSNRLHRPIGIGVQGLADCFFLLDLPFESDEAAYVNAVIFEHMYFAALEESCAISRQRSEAIMYLQKMYNAGQFVYINNEEHCNDYVVIKQENNDTTEVERLLAEYRPIRAELRNVRYPGAYSSYDGSPMSKGILQFDMWDDVTLNIPIDRWNRLRKDIATYGVRNSMLMAPMPTASTSQILGNVECFEPISSNIHTRRTLAGEFVVLNQYMASELLQIGLWREDIKNSIIENRGSVQHIQNISENFKNKYKTVWEISMKRIIELARGRAPFIDQSQSMNLWLEDPSPSTMTSMHLYAWRKGLKTGIYYMRRKPKYNAQQFTIEPDKCMRQDDCIVCSS